MKRRLLAFGMAVVLTGTLAGCGFSAKSQETQKPAAPATQETTTRGEVENDSSVENHELIMAWWGNQTRNERTQKSIDLYMQNNLGVDIEGQFAEWDGYWDKLATMASGGTLPDVIQQHSNYLIQYNEADLLMDLTPYVENGMLDISEISQNVIDLGTVDGKLLAVCSGVGTWGLTYNATLLEENGIEIHDNMTIQEFIDISRAVYEKTGYKTCLSATVSDGAAIMSHILRGAGYEIWQDSGLGVEKYEDMKIFFDIIELGVTEGWLIDPSVLVERNGNEQQPIVYGETPAEKSWCIPSASNVYLSYVSAAPEGTELKLTTVPSDDIKKSNSVMASQFFSVSNQTKDPDTAIAFLNWMINSTDANSILLGERGVPANDKVVTAISSLVDEPTKNSMSFVNDVVSPNCSGASPATGAKMTEVKDAFGQLYEQLCYGEITSEDAAKTLFEKANAILGK